MKKVLITGAKGQLGLSIRSITEANMPLELIFTDREELDITQKDSVLSFFRDHAPDYCINCAAYTQVDQAEKEPDRCFEINVKGVQNLVTACTESQCILIHISTDFVFDGKKGTPYCTTDKPNPINVYGTSKHESEQIIQKALSKYFIVRTSWLYSEYGNNFVKTMLRLGEEREEILVVNDQIGSPTYSGDLAAFLFRLIGEDNQEWGVYHYSNKGKASWFEFAQAIIEIKGLECMVFPTTSEEYKTAAKRPAYSILDTTKTERLLRPDILRPWLESLERCLQKSGD